MTDALPDPLDSFELPMSDGIALSVRRLGNAAGPRLFLSHGNGFAIDGYRVFWQPLLERFDVILFDMRNHGRSGLSHGDAHTYAQMARDLDDVYLGVTRRLGEKACAGVFHSMSARAAMKHATEIAWRWDALVLFDPPNVPPRGHRHYEAMRAFELRLVEWAANRPDSFASIDDLAKINAEARASARWQGSAHADMARAVLRHDDETGEWRLSCRREFEAAIYLAALNLDLWPPLEAYGGPIMLIGADPEMPYTPPTAFANRALHEDFAYPYTAIANAGHMLQIEQPEACRAALIEFLQACKLA